MQNEIQRNELKYISSKQYINHTLTVEVWKKNLSNLKHTILTTYSKSVAKE